LREIPKESRKPKKNKKTKKCNFSNSKRRIRSLAKDPVEDVILLVEDTKLAASAQGKRRSARKEIGTPAFLWS